MRAAWRDLGGVCVAVMAIAGCGDEPAPAPVATNDVACAAEPSDDCKGCFENLGTCCYDDPTINGRVDEMAEDCATREDCRICCNECKAMACTELVARNDCPGDVPPDAGR